ncbi:uncharacterized [Tachysurus ichikawai]
MAELELSLFSVLLVVPFPLLASEQCVSSADKTALANECNLISGVYAGLFTSLISPWKFRFFSPEAVDVL